MCNVRAKVLPDEDMPRRAVKLVHFALDQGRHAALDRILRVRSRPSGVSNPSVEQEREGGRAKAARLSAYEFARQGRAAASPLRRARTIGRLDSVAHLKHRVDAKLDQRLGNLLLHVLIFDLCHLCSERLRAAGSHMYAAVHTSAPLPIRR